MSIILGISFFPARSLSLFFSFKMFSQGFLFFLIFLLLLQICSFVAPRRESLFHWKMGDEHSRALTGRDEEEKLSNEHVILKTPLRPPFPEGYQRIVLATGCYWGAEKGFWRLPGVFSTAVGYAGGLVKNPTYQEACTGKTGFFFHKYF